ncbi:MAG: VIT domain-containing protein [Elusimicrobiales bacterium]|nr:VIT domain-containing protein [Elusimicrobiales bacterium]
MKTMTLIRKTLAPALLLGLAGLLPAQVQDLGQGSMQIKGDALRILPLKRTEVKAEISGFVAEVLVTQVFGNTSDKPIEAVYVFPLPDNAAVNDLTLTVGDRVIKGQIKKREEARQVYEQAKALGQTAVLLDQERPNIFTQSVANIQPGREIKVTLKYLQNLDYDHGVYKFAFPMTVGPRYIPGEPAGKSGTGWARDTAQVPDASRITPPVTRPGQRSGRNITVEVKLNAGLAVKNIRSSSHEITVKALGANAAEIALDPGDRIPNKDFLLTYEPDGKAVDAAVLAHKDGKEGYLTLIVQPQADFPLSDVTPKELVFALDVSGSMSGFPVETAKETALRCLEGMNPGDTFQIFSFASGNQLHFERPLRNTPENVALGRTVINELHGGGGTEMLEALRKVLEFPKDPARLRIVLFMTDGYIGNDPEILAFIKEHLNGSRIFPLGVGSSPNRYLLEEMAVLGKGTVQYVRQDEKPAKLEKVIEKFYDRISKPVLTDLAVDWKGLDVADASPAVLRDLFSGQPVFIHARYKKAGSAAVVLRGKMKGQPWEMPVQVNLPARETANAALGPLWARSRITELSRAMYGRQDAGLKEKITGLALEHKLVSEYTSFVAVDQSTAAPGQAPLLVPVESALPEGTRYEGFFGGAGGAAGRAMGSVVAAVRGSFGQAKYASPAASLSFGFRAGGGGLERREAANEVQAVDAAVANGDSRVAALAGELLAEPSTRLARQLISLQEASGAFVEPDGKAVPLADQALAVLALAKAKAEYGAEMDGALRRAWGYLRAKTPAGLGAKAAVTNALKGGPYLGRAAVQAELEALAKVLGELK